MDGTCFPSLSVPFFSYNVNHYEMNVKMCCELRESTTVRQEKQETVPMQDQKGSHFIRRALFLVITLRAGVTCATWSVPSLLGKSLNLSSRFQASPNPVVGTKEIMKTDFLFGRSKMRRDFRMYHSFPPISLPFFIQTNLKQQRLKTSTLPYYNCTMGTQPAGVFSSPREVGMCLLPVHSLPQ